MTRVLRILNASDMCNHLLVVAWQKRCMFEGSGWRPGLKTTLACSTAACVKGRHWLVVQAFHFSDAFMTDSALFGW
jgi:hypothetical protein